MKASITRAVRELVCFALLLTTASAWCQESAMDVSPVVPASTRAVGVHVQQRLGTQIPLTSAFRDRNGAGVTFGEVLNNKPAIVLPIFYRCTGVCSQETENLIEVLQKLPKKVGRDFNVIIVGIDPQETPAMAEQKFESAIAPVKDFEGTDTGWHFLTGTLDQIRNVTDSLGFFYSYDPQTDLINHPAGLMFLTRTGRVSGYILNPYTYSPDEFTKDLSTAVTSTVGEPVPDELFGCIHSDSVTGKKSLNIMRFLSLAGGVTVVLLVGMVWGLSRKSKSFTA